MYTLSPTSNLRWLSAFPSEMPPDSTRLQILENFNDLQGCNISLWQQHRHDTVYGNLYFVHI